MVIYSVIIWMTRCSSTFYNLGMNWNKQVIRVCGDTCRPKKETACHSYRWVMEVKFYRSFLFSIFYKSWKRTNVLHLFLSEFPSIVNNSPLNLKKPSYISRKRGMQILCRLRTLGVVHLHCGVHSSSISFERLSSCIRVCQLFTGSLINFS